MTPLIETDLLAAGYGGNAVLRDVTLRFDGGASGLLGPNGAGKSTLIKTLLGFLPPVSGTARVFGLDTPSQAREIRARVGYMPEQEAYIAGMSGVQFTAYMAELSGIPRAQAMERAHLVLQYVGLGESRYRNLDEYSTGMKQRAKLAQAIVHDPQLVLLDEPTNGMDPAGRAEMLELVNDLAHSKGVSVILCSHILGDVETVADDIIVMGSGRVQSRKMRDRRDDTVEHPYLVRFRGSGDAFEQALRKRGLEFAPAESPQERFVRLGTLPPRTVFEAAAESGCLVRRLEVPRERLEDVFVRTLEELGHAHL